MYVNTQRELNSPGIPATICQEMCLAVAWWLDLVAVVLRKLMLTASSPFLGWHVGLEVSELP